MKCPDYHCTHTVTSRLKMSHWNSRRKPVYWPSPFCTKFKLIKGQTRLIYTYETYSKVYLQKRTQSMFKIAQNQRNLDSRSRIPKRKHIDAVKSFAHMSSRIDIVTLWHAGHVSGNRWFPLTFIFPITANISAYHSSS